MALISVTPELSVPDEEITFTASRSGGPGGQNVNKVSTRVTLSFDLRNSSALSEIQRIRISQKLQSRINKDGILRVVSQRTRSQDLNRADALDRFVELLKDALSVDPIRVRTRPSRASKEKRLQEKKRLTGIKKERSKKGWID